MNSSEKDKFYRVETSTVTKWLPAFKEKCICEVCARIVLKAVVEGQSDH
jgi:hypothetical protein